MKRVHKDTGTNATLCGVNVTTTTHTTNDWDNVDCIRCRKAGKRYTKPAPFKAQRFDQLKLF